MQLTRALPLLLCALLAGRSARADSGADATTTVYYEAGGPLETMVVTPAVQGRVDTPSGVFVDAAWEADVVSGASVAVVDGPSTDVDAVTGATRLDDFRNVFSGGLGVSDGAAQVQAHFGHGFERDYLSNTLQVGASTDLFDRNTTFEIGYTRSWDRVCDLAQPDAVRPVERIRLPSSDGCFESDDRTTRRLDLHTLQGTWTQSWTPLFNTQLQLKVQQLRGFQSNPYRAVWLGRTAAQEHHPGERARYALGLQARVWIAPLGGALQLMGRAYRDTWDVSSGTGEIAFERGFEGWVRVRLRGRYYYQTAAAFFSDDYALRPAGQFFTGDRELSGMSSALVGGRVEVHALDRARDETIRVSAFRIVLKADGLFLNFRDFHYGNAAVPVRTAMFGTLSLELDL